MCLYRCSEFISNNALELYPEAGWGPVVLRATLDPPASISTAEAYLKYVAQKKGSFVVVEGVHRCAAALELLSKKVLKWDKVPAFVLRSTIDNGICLKIGATFNQGHDSGVKTTLGERLFMARKLAQDHKWDNGTLFSSKTGKQTLFATLAKEMNLLLGRSDQLLKHTKNELQALRFPDDVLDIIIEDFNDVVIDAESSDVVQARGRMLNNQVTVPARGPYYYLYAVQPQFCLAAVQEVHRLPHQELKDNRKAVHMKHLWRAYLYKVLQEDVKFVASQQKGSRRTTLPFAGQHSEAKLQELLAGSWDACCSPDWQAGVLSFLKSWNELVHEQKFHVPTVVKLQEWRADSDAQAELEKLPVVEMPRNFMPQQAQAADSAQVTTEPPAPATEATQEPDHGKAKPNPRASEYFKYGWKDEKCYHHLVGDGDRFLPDLKNARRSVDIHHQAIGGAEWIGVGRNERNTVSLCILDPPFGIFESCDEPLSDEDFRRLFMMCDNMGNDHCVIVSHCGNHESDASFETQRRGLMAAMNARTSINHDKAKVCV